jgi:hypothetical protein
MQEYAFSQPHPSPSGSESAERQYGQPLAVALGITPLALLLEELRLLEERIEELLEEIMLLLDEERILEELNTVEELDRIELELNDELDNPHEPTTPKGDGWLVQVDVDIQLLLFSYPQPLCVEMQTGYIVPYQLQ